jgi:hypothetical protein
LVDPKELYEGYPVDAQQCTEFEGFIFLYGVPEQAALACRWLDSWHKTIGHIWLSHVTFVVVARQQGGDNKPRIQLRTTFRNNLTFAYFGTALAPVKIKNQEPNLRLLSLRQRCMQ